jgi:2-polyprenyl-3-methyl-5-hydroxy-6-metoxy-1,4-benzoquinol methylase
VEKNRNEKILESWNENASQWTNAVRMQALETRRLVTNDAILEAVLSCGGTRILDVGCGEGWLSHALTAKGKDVIGFDGCASLIGQARKETPERFHVLTYEEFVTRPNFIGKDCDVVVCNFSLFSDRLDQILEGLFAITKPSGHLIIQTLHPYSSVGEQRYEDAWREETFQGLPEQWSPMPWFFRTMGSWLRELRSAHWKLEELKEPLHPVSGKPASLIIKAIK